MRLSQLLFVTLREEPSDAEVNSHKLLIRAGYIKRVGNGTYAYLPLMWKVMQKVSQIIREEMNNIGAQECLLPQLQPSELWHESGRWEDYTKIDGTMFTLFDRRGNELALGPTHEEVITNIAKDMVHSYQQLPFCLYQIQTKFRDEVRPKSGLLRSKEFIMKDGYSFHKDEESLIETYKKVRQAYHNVFQRCGLDYLLVEADSGSIGNGYSQEFMAIAGVGDDDIVYTEDKSYVANIELHQIKPYTSSETLLTTKGIEVGHIFQLGTKYSKAMEATFTDEVSREVPLVMGCYGIGVSRLVQTVVEQSYDKDGIIWPVSIAPYHVIIIIINMDDKLQVEVGERVYQDLQQAGIEVLLDDRQERAGVKFKDTDLIGIPYRITIGKSIKEGKVELMDRVTHTTQEVLIGGVISLIKQEIQIN
jgi:prolyl-tRNA synthetase